MTSSKQRVSPVASGLGYQAITAKLRKEIVAGRLQPGQQLPSRPELERRFRSTPVTIQRAMDLLREHGYVRVELRRGTFVVDHPPHLSHYALAFPWPRHQNVSQFFRALRQQAEQLTKTGRKITCFDEIGRHVDTEDYQRLNGLVRSHRLAGVIFAANPYMLAGLPPLEEPGVPRVAIAVEQHQLTVPSVYPDVTGFYERAFEKIATAGRRRVALITLAGAASVDTEFDQVATLAAARGLQIERRWMLGAPADAPHWARHATELLFESGRATRPDALVIADDNLVPEATAGLRTTGARVPAEVLVVAQTSFPYPTPAAVPVTRVGFDISQLLALCVERIDQQRRGESPPVHTAIPAIVEAEMYVSSPPVKSESRVVV